MHHPRRHARTAAALASVLLLGALVAAIPRADATHQVCASQTYTLLCDDFDRTSLGTSWEVDDPTVTLSSNTLRMVETNGYAQVVHVANTNLGEGDLELRWTPNSVPQGWKELRIYFRDDALENHVVFLRVGSGDVCFNWENGVSQCQPFAWTAGWYDVHVSHKNATLVVRINGATVMTLSYPAAEKATRLRIAAADDGSAQNIEYILYRTALPSMPLNPGAATGPGAGEITVSWSPPAYTGGLPVTSYKIYRAATLAGPWDALVSTVGGSVTTWKDTGLSASTTRYYRVAAVNSAGQGALGDAVGATTYSPPAKPATPAAAGGPGAGQITVSWSAPASPLPITSYQVDASSAPGGPWTTTTVTGALSWTQAGLPAGTTRYYRVAAVSDAGQGAWSNVASAATFDVPGAPHSLQAAAGGSAGEISLSWQPPPSNGGASVTGYEVHAAEQSAGPYTLVGTPTGTSFLHEDLGDAVTRFYRVKAVNVVGAGSPSDVANATTLTLDSAPQNVQATPGPEVIFVHWEPPRDQEVRPVDHYRIYSGTSAAFKFWQMNSKVTAVADDAEAGVVTHYQVSAISPLGESPLSHEARAAAYGIGQGTTGVRSLFKMNNFTVAQGVSTPPSQPVLVVTVRNHSVAPQTCLDVTVPAAGLTRNVACWSQLIPGDDQIPRGSTPIGGTTEEDLEHRVTITAAYLFDTQRLWEAASLADGTIRVYAPASPTDGAWWTGEEGAEMGIRVHALVWKGADLVEAREIFLPRVGQALAAAEFSTGTQP